MGTRILSTGLAILYSIVAFTGCSSRSRDDSTGHRPLTAADSAAARDVVVRFGERLQRVSLLAPDSLARVSIRSEYGGFVSPALLETWLEHPSGAPGRVTSSPWPDRIEIVEARATPNGAPHIAYVGSIVERASDTPPGEAVRRIPVRITLVRGPEGWRIVQFAQVDIRRCQSLGIFGFEPECQRAAQAGCSRPECERLGTVRLAELLLKECDLFASDPLLGRCQILRTRRVQHGVQAIAQVSALFEANTNP